MPRTYLVGWGITPAYAGNTLIKLKVSVFTRDHPRLRGEHYNYRYLRGLGEGSPPPTRGTPIVSLFHSIQPRITPAYAGNTSIRRNRIPLYQDHPRLRGEHFISSIIIIMLPGSPPPTRGTQYLNDRCMFLPGITPAYAGNTLC